MGFSYRKSFKAGPIRITASKSGVSYSAGVKGARITKRADGRVQTTLSAPGTGLRHTTTSGGAKRSTRPAPTAPAGASKADLKAAYQAFYIQALDQLRAGHSGAEIRGFLHTEGIATPQLLKAVTDAEQQIARDLHWQEAAQLRAQQEATHEALSHEVAEHLVNGVPYIHIADWLKRQHRIQLADCVAIVYRARKINKGKA